MEAGMRGIGLSISRLSTARAVLAGAALLAGAAMRPAEAEIARGSATAPDETAMVMPRVHAPAGTGGLGLPQPLAPSEAARIRRIFALQRAGNLQVAAVETGRLTDQTLLGHILADRYLNRPTRVSAPALSDWLGRYADLPDACAIYGLLLHKLPPGMPRPVPPPSASLASGPAKWSSGPSLAGGAAREALLRGRNDMALRIGRAAWERSHGTDGQSAYVAGLAAWRLQDEEEAATLFGAASVAEEAGPGLQAAAAFWAARAHLHGGDALGWRSWMRRAAAEPQTLHGMLAAQLLGLHPTPVLPRPIAAEADLEAVAAMPQGRRAFALLQVGESSRAESELRLLWGEAQANPPLARAIMLVANAANMTSLVADLSEATAGEAALLPLPVLHPRGGFKLTPALVYAVTWVESNFDSSAHSAAGAHGLMQLTGVAAGALGRDTISQDELHNPALNLALGQQYLSYLARHDFAGDNLLRVLASYNAGPVASSHWKFAHTDDPLMFLEIIPTDETRHFVSRTLTALWSYAARFGEPSLSLDALAAGDWPLFSAEVLPIFVPRQHNPENQIRLASARLH
jgi:soluble lytic murein transglycosylase-like protein